MPKRQATSSKEGQKKAASDAKGFNLSLVATIVERERLTPTEAADWVRTIDHLRSLEAQTSVRDVLVALGKRRQ